MALVDDDARPVTHLAAAGWRTSQSGTVAHFFAPDGLTADSGPVCGFDLPYRSSVPQERSQADGRHVQMCEDCRTLVGLLSS